MAEDSETAVSAEAHMHEFIDEFDSSPHDESCKNSSTEGANVRYFRQDDFIESIIDSLKTIPDMPASVDTQRPRIAGELRRLFDERFKEIGALETLQRMEAPTTVEEPSVSFEDSNQRFDVYVREHFQASIKRRYLPLGELSDKKLRRRISVEKSRGKFPDDLDKICLTQNECAAIQREAVAKITGIRNSTGLRFAQFARRLVPQGFR